MEETQHRNLCAAVKKLMDIDEVKDGVRESEIRFGFRGNINLLNYRRS
jgi:hypothetical protein